MLMEINSDSHSNLDSLFMFQLCILMSTHIYKSLFTCINVCIQIIRTLSLLIQNCIKYCDNYIINTNYYIYTFIINIIILQIY